MEDTYIHILKVPDKILSKEVCFLEEGFVYRSGGLGVVVPGDGGALVGVDDFDPLNAGIGEDAGAGLVRAGLTD